jgi:hypothetical protein
MSLQLCFAYIILRYTLQATGEPGHGKSTLIEHLFDRRISSLNAFSSGSTSASSKLYTPIQRISQGVGRINQGHHVRNTGSIRVRKTDQNQINGSINKGQESTSTSAGLPALNEEVLMDDRLQPTEGMAVDYEWVEVNDADIGEQAILSLTCCSCQKPLRVNTD